IYLHRHQAHQFRFGAKPIVQIVSELAATCLEEFISAARNRMRKLLHLLKELFSLDEDRAVRSLLLRGLYSLLGCHFSLLLVCWKLIETAFLSATEMSCAPNESAIYVPAPGNGTHLPNAMAFPLALKIPHNRIFDRYATCST